MKMTNHQYKKACWLWTYRFLIMFVTSGVLTITASCTVDETREVTYYGNIVETQNMIDHRSHGGKSPRTYYNTRIDAVIRVEGTNEITVRSVSYQTDYLFRVEKQTRVQWTETQMVPYAERAWWRKVANHAGTVLLCVMLASMIGTLVAIGLAYPGRKRFQNELW